MAAIRRSADSDGPFVDASYGTGTAFAPYIWQYTGYIANVGAVWITRSPSFTNASNTIRIAPSEPAVISSSAGRIPRCFASFS